MGSLYLVRHGQASFGAVDYDQLSDLGARQCARLGEWFRAHGKGFDAVFSGTLKRHAQSLRAIESTLGAQPAVQRRSGLDEYDSHALIRSVYDGPLAPATSPAEARVHFRLLRDGLAEWMAGRAQPQGMPTHSEFTAGIAAALDHVREHHADGNVLVVSSGGPISHAVGQVLGLAHEAVIELNLRLRNSAVCEFKVSPKRHSLITFNTLPHLSEPEHQGWVTHA